MNGDNYSWNKLKDKKLAAAENMLRNVERDYVSACGRFLSHEAGKDGVWALNSNKNEIKAIIINSKSTLMPVLCGLNNIPDPKFIKSLILKKYIHSVQGLIHEADILEAAMERNGKKPVDSYNYDLMDLDKLPVQTAKRPKGLVLRIPRLSDLDALAPLQAGYEHEEVLPKGSVFNPAASRMNLANIIAGGKILTAELNGKMVGKINVNAQSFTRYMIGGVYVYPDFRCLGIASVMASVFINSLVNEGMGITLFVKKSNTAARKLYQNLGFTIKGDYRITYY